MNPLKININKNHYVFLLRVFLIIILIGLFFTYPVMLEAFSPEDMTLNFTNFSFNSYPNFSTQFGNFQVSNYGLNNLNLTNNLFNLNTNHIWNGAGRNYGLFTANNSFGLYNSSNILGLNIFNNQSGFSFLNRSYNTYNPQSHSLSNLSLNNNPFSISPVNAFNNLNGSFRDLQSLNNLFFLTPPQRTGGQNNNQGQENTEDYIHQPTPEGIRLARLKPLTSCDELLAQLKADAIQEMEEEIDLNIEKVVECEGCCYTYYYPWRSASYYNIAYTPSVSLYSASYAGMDYTTSALQSPQPSPSPPGVQPQAFAGESLSESATEYSTTNIQVKGVDEADFIKNDGSYIYILANDKFQIIDAWPPKDADIISTFETDGIPRKLFVANDRALIYSSMEYINCSDSYYGRSGSNNECTYGYNCDFTGDNRKLKITILDISDRSDPKLVREIKFGGSYINSRRVGTAVHTVVLSPAYFAPELKYWPDLYDQCRVIRWYDVPYYYGSGYIYSSPYIPPDPPDPPDDGPTLDELLEAFEQLKEENRKIIEDSTIEDWFPAIQDIIYAPDGSVISDSTLYDCSKFYETERPDNKTFLTILSMDIDSNEEPNQRTIYGSPGAVYSSPYALYISSRQRYEYGRKWFYDKSTKIREASTVHKFKLNNESPASCKYIGSGVVKGKVLNQFSMDEHEGYLRIATTTGHVPSPDVHSTLSVLEEKHDELRVIGRVDKIAPKEDIRSVRFNGDKGFIVTFKKTDPLFAFDLSKPHNPKIVGELKIPGFSTYMHLMDDDHLLTIGYDADDRDSFAWFQGIMLQIFDVSDMSNPTLLHKEVIGTRGSSSEAATNHLAFNYFAPKDLLAIPMTICEGGSGGGSYGTDMTFSGLLVYDVTVEKGFSLLGGVSHQDPDCESNCRISCSNWWTNSNSVVKRSIFMDDYVFSVALDQIIINDLDALGVDISVIDLLQ